VAGVRTGVADATTVKVAVGITATGVVVVDELHAASISAIRSTTIPIAEIFIILPPRPANGWLHPPGGCGQEHLPQDQLQARGTIEIAAASPVGWKPLLARPLLLPNGFVPL